MFKTRLWISGGMLLSVVLASLLAGCGGSGEATPLAGDVTITSPSSASVTMQTGQQLQLAASVTGNTNTSIGWIVKKGGVQVQSSIAGTTFTVPATAPVWGSDTYTIEAYNTADVTKRDMATVEVQNTKTNSIDGAVMVWVPGGQFYMGRNTNDTTRTYNPYREASEFPQHPVILSGYWVYKYEVTISQYQQFTATHPLYWRPGMAGQASSPVANVKHSEAIAYAQWAGGTLPTEAQWEKTARGTENRAYPWGNSWVDGYCHLWQNSTPPVDVVAVGSKINDISQYGVMDLGGNVSEWCNDNYGSYPVDAITVVTDPDGFTNTGIDLHMFAVRGGSWGTFGNVQTSGRCAERSSGGDGSQLGTDGYNAGIGFRCVKN